MKFVIQTGYGEARFVTTVGLWSVFDDFLILLLPTHAAGLDWIGANNRCARITAQNPLMVPYDDEPRRLVAPATHRNEQHHAAIQGSAAVVECRGDILASNGWETEWQQVIIDHGGSGSVASKAPRPAQLASI